MHCFQERPTLITDIYQNFLSDLELFVKKPLLALQRRAQGRLACGRQREISLNLQQMRMLLVAVFFQKSIGVPFVSCSC